ncbi:hypothetical protein [Enterococcus faecium]|uniref:hypothetical protein n=1 Tax=Enterococcus faecium TaxID=1352 RepID=UPI000763EF1A|nr:hypothetical protein [Enterococcus faecium]KWY55710.1 hypothetical protein AS244_09130 [Enterococcus faecium]
MEVRIRNVDEKIVREIDRRCDELSNRTGNKWSRNDYLKLLVENDFDRPLMEYKSSPDSCVKCYTMFLPFLLIKIDVFS